MKNIYIYYQNRNKGPVESLIRCRPQLESKDCKLYFLCDKENPTIPKNADLILAQQYYVTPNFLEAAQKSGVSVILMERADAAISWCRKEAQHPAVKKILKVGILNPGSLNNETAGRYHANIIQPELKREPSIKLNSEQLHKYRSAPSYGSYDMMQRWIDRRIDWEDPRKYTVHYCVTTKYGERTEFEKHRVGVFPILEQIPGPHLTSKDRHFPRDQYDYFMLQSRIVISPWGFGEVTYRDFEALYAGCLLIKPRTDFVKTWPDIFTPEHVFFCEPDWSDLKELVLELNSKWNTFDSRRRNSRNLLVSHWDEEVLAKHFWKLFREIENEAGTP